MLELGQALARAGTPQAIAPLSEIVAHSNDEEAVVAAAIELSGMLFFAGRPAEGAAILHRAQQRVPANGLGREQLDVALLGASYTSFSARRAAEPMILQLRDPGGPARSMLEATTLGILAMDEAMYLRSAAKARDMGRRALAAGLPLEPHRGGNWAILALAALALSDDYEASMQGMDAILAQARRRGVALTVANVSALRALIAGRIGDLNSAEADAQAAIELAPDLLGAEYVVLAVTAAVLAGLDRDETPESLRQLIDRSGIRYDTEFLPSSQLRYASGVLRAAAGNHAAAVEELLSCELEHPTFGGENPAVVAVAVGSCVLARRARPPRGSSRSGRRRGSPRAGIRRSPRDRDGAARSGPRGSAGAALGWLAGGPGGDFAVRRAPRTRAGATGRGRHDPGIRTKSSGA